MEYKAPKLRPDYRGRQAFSGDNRSEERLRAHYILERDLAGRLREAQPADRAKVYNEVYSELFRALPDHPQTVEMNTGRKRRARGLLTRLMPFLGRDKTFLEIGCGDAVLSRMAAPHTA